MEGFKFSLAKGVSLRPDADGFLLVSRTPIKILQINKSLYNLIKHISTGGGELTDFPITNPQETMQVLLKLVARGYLKLEKTAKPKEFPFISVIIPVRDQPQNLLECLKALQNVRYPKDRLEIIVVDDGSKEKLEKVVTNADIKIISHEKSKGAAACRNIGAEKAKGEILAFLDADCIAAESWLEELVPFFKYAATGAVGGYIDGHSDRTWLERYEKSFSPLNMGSRLIIEGKDESGFYVPTANLLVSREAFSVTGGFKEGMEVGEDVDFCWRLREQGYNLIYTPSGKVAHKHRNQLSKMLKRRFEYGTSEALLYRTHRDKKKGFPFSPLSGLSFIALTLAVLLANPYPLCALPLLYGSDIWWKFRTIRKYKVDLNFGQLAAAALRNLLSFYYYAFFHLIRYYLVLVIGLGAAWWPFWVWGGAAVIYASVTDYIVKKPKLFYLVFVYFYLLEHLAYQVGVFWGCIKYRYFGSYRLSFKGG
jgi:mycofactocin system glycosyltransferase